jgi:LDH2 family malate/lactate/ureidoglycolate dehydrogenase
MPYCIGHKDLMDFVTEVLIGVGFEKEHARVVADHLVLANLRGVDSHGVMRLPVYVEAVEKGVINPRPRLRVVREGPGYALIDGDWGLGHVVTYYATQVAAQKAQTLGVGVSATRNHWHSGMLAYYILHLTSRGLAGIVMANSSPRMSLPGLKAAIVGTNPLAIGVPGPEYPVVFDAAMSVVAYGKIVDAAKRGEEIPPGWALDSEGRETTDPRKAAYVLPIGGYKGLGIAIMIDILCGILAGARYGLQIEPSLYSQGGTLVIAINVEAFRPLSDFTRELTSYISRIKATPGEREVLMPGEREHRTYLARLRQGIPLPEQVYDELKTLASKYRVQLPPAKPCPTT